MVRLVEDRILAENMSMQAACQAVAPKLGGVPMFLSSARPMLTSTVLGVVS
ncbi:transposase for IS3523 [Corynebacterium jeikeium K411]|uniref:Transposase for IS3523 n=1 Tax=Corynebacterium jeikeium (strain K411) TaxID=306537 RepID=Q4JUT5_CORJK|nr:transposase for IS3523 [Corynebacterium jeikeium K411]